MATTFSEAWDGTYESEPADTENINLGASRIRSLKVQVHARLGVDHSWNGDSNDGKHNAIQLRDVGEPVLDPTDGSVFASANTGTNGITELFYKDSNANLTLITRNGSVNVPAVFASGTVMLFVQPAAPAGWVQSPSFNDMVLRVVNDNSGQTVGGGWAITGLSAGTTIGGTALTSAQIPAHTHQINNAVSTLSPSFPPGTTGTPFMNFSTTLTTDGGTGGGQPHTHAASTSVVADGTWRPAYVNSLVAVKQ